MNGLLFRTRVAVLWGAVATAMVGSLVLMVFTPGGAEGLVAGEIEGEALTDAIAWMFTAIGILPLVMVGVTLLANDRLNRLLNLIVGSAFGLFGAFAFVSHTLAGDFNGHVLMVAVAGVLALLIAGLGLAEFRRPQLPAREREPSRPREEATV